MMVPGHSQGLCNLNFVGPKGESPQACSSGVYVRGKRGRGRIGARHLSAHIKNGVRLIITSDVSSSEW